MTTIYSCSVSYLGYNLISQYTAVPSPLIHYHEYHNVVLGSRDRGVCLLYCRHLNSELFYFLPVYGCWNDGTCSYCCVCWEKDILCTLVHSVLPQLSIKLKDLHNIVNRYRIWLITACSKETCSKQTFNFKGIFSYSGTQKLWCITDGWLIGVSL